MTPRKKNIAVSYPFFSVSNLSSTFPKRLRCDFSNVFAPFLYLCTSKENNEHGIIQQNDSNGARRSRASSGQHPVPVGRRSHHPLHQPLPKRSNRRTRRSADRRNKRPQRQVVRTLQKKRNHPLHHRRARKADGRTAPPHRAKLGFHRTGGHLPALQAETQNPCRSRPPERTGAPCHLADAATRKQSGRPPAHLCER